MHPELVSLRHKVHHGKSVGSHLKYKPQTPMWILHDQKGGGEGKAGFSDRGRRYPKRKKDGRSVRILDLNEENYTKDGTGKY